MDVTRVVVTKPSRRTAATRLIRVPDQIMCTERARRCFVSVQGARSVRADSSVQVMWVWLVSLMRSSRTWSVYSTAWS